MHHSPASDAVFANLELRLDLKAPGRHRFGGGSLSDSMTRVSEMNERSETVSSTCPPISSGLHVTNIESFGTRQLAVLCVVFPQLPVSLPSTGGYVGSSLDEVASCRTTPVEAPASGSAYLPPQHRGMRRGHRRACGLRDADVFGQFALAHVEGYPPGPRTWTLCVQPCR